MCRVSFFRLSFCAVLLTIACGFFIGNRLVFSFEGKPAPRETSKTLHGRLPPYYSRVVTPQQRKKIYEIQAEYRPKIKIARARLNALINEQKEKIAEVLSTEQKLKLAEIKKLAKMKKKGAETPLLKLKNKKNDVADPRKPADYTEQ